MSIHSIKTLQHLARIHLQPDEMESLSQDLDKVFSWIGQLDTLCVQAIDHDNDRTMIMREDAVVDGHQVDFIVRNAPAAKGSFFTVPKVLKS